jgi:hypothetical protein
VPLDDPLTAPEPGVPTAPPRPLLFLDVDGPLNPFAAPGTRRPPGYTTHRMRPAGWLAVNPQGRSRLRHYIRPLRVRLNPQHGPELLRLPFDLVWATTWEREANSHIGPRIGLPELPVVAWPRAATPGAAAPETGVVRPPDGPRLYWKTRHLADYAAGRPFAWVDDHISTADVRWCAEEYPAPTLLLPIDARSGLQAGDFAALERWAVLHASR